MEFHDFHEIHDFYGKVWNSRKNHPKATFRARGRNSSNSYAFLHGSEAARVLWEPEWWNSLVFTKFSRIPPFWWNVVKFGAFWCLGGGNLDFTRSSMKTQSILGLLRCFFRPDRYFSLKSTHFRWFSLKSPKIVEFLVLGRKIPFWGEAGWKFHQFRTVITVVFTPGAKGSTFHLKTPKTQEFI